jgi:hypothetical protein
MKAKVALGMGMKKGRTTKKRKTTGTKKGRGLKKVKKGHRRGRRIIAPKKVGGQLLPLLSLAALATQALRTGKKQEKVGGFLPILGILGALGAAAGGAAGIARAVNSAKEADKSLKEAARHNRAMEAALSGKKGSGLRLGPWAGEKWNTPPFLPSPRGTRGSPRKP